MEQNYVDGLKDYITQRPFTIESNSNLDTAKFRAKMKSGVGTLNFYGLKSIVWAVERGVGSGVERDNTNDLAVGNYITIFFKHNSTFRHNYSSSASDMGSFLSQFEIIYDPLPEFVSTGSGSVTIDSPDFSAPKGIFDNPAGFRRQNDFSGSTFTDGPKIYSELVMIELQSFPPGPTSTSIWRPFQGCDDLVRIENQGVFGPFLDYLGPCDFTVYDDDGVGNISAYPSGGSPVVIDRFVNALTVTFDQKFPEFDSSRLRIAYKPFNIELLFINAGTPELPFGGIDYSKATRCEKLVLPTPKVYMDPQISIWDEANIIFGWGSLGIVAPPTCTVLGGVHTLFHKVVNVNEPSHIATPSFLSGYNSGWGNRLAEWLSDHSGDLTPDLMPLVPSGVVNIGSYYKKLITHGEYITDNIYQETLDFTSFLTEVQLDGTPHAHQVQALPAGVEVVSGYCESLYAHQRLSTSITIPALPSSIRIARDCYRRTFWNAVGEARSPVLSFESDTTALVVWHKTVDDGNPKMYVVPNAEFSTSTELINHFDNMKKLLIFKDEGIASGRISATSNLTWKPIQSTLKYNTITAPDYETWINDVVDVEYSIDYFVDFIDKGVSLPYNAMPNLEYAGGWQEECWFGACINPEINDLLIPLPEGKEWNAYAGALQLCIIRTEEQGFEPTGWWRGEIELDESTYALGGILITPRYPLIQFIAIVDGGKPDLSSLSQYRYDIDNLIMSGTGREEGSDVIKPYRKATSYTSLAGDREQFLIDHSIILNNDNNFTVDKDGGVDVSGPTIVPVMGFNAIRKDVDGLRPHQKRQYIYAVSTVRKITMQLFYSYVSDGGGKLWYGYMTCPLDKNEVPNITVDPDDDRTFDEVWNKYAYNYRNDGGLTGRVLALCFQNDSLDDKMTGKPAWRPKYVSDKAFWIYSSANRNHPDNGDIEVTGNFATPAENINTYIDWDWDSL